MSFEPRDYLRHIVVEADYLMAHSSDLTREHFSEDETLRRAFVRNLEIIGEAAKKVRTGFALGIRTSDGGRWQACATGSFTTTSAWTMSVSGTWSGIAFPNCVASWQRCSRPNRPLQPASGAQRQAGSKRQGRRFAAERQDVRRTYWLLHDSNRRSGTKR